ncbi:MAG: C_GCAxxG_C_C family protein [Faecalibacterium sp.]|nr:C_GCAxxG_C_C family protein [Faecalibacterium sp.]
MSRYGEKAVEYFKRGYNCSQSVVAPFAEELGLSEELALKLSCGFGGGIGRLREMCGALCGVVMVLGLEYADAQNPASRSDVYDKVQLLAQQYKAESGRDTYICRELLANSSPTPGTRAEERTEGYYKRRPCVELVRMSAELLAEHLAQNP